MDRVILTLTGLGVGLLAGLLLFGLDSGLWDPATASREERDGVAVVRDPSQARVAVGGTEAAAAIDALRAQLDAERARADALGRELALLRERLPGETTGSDDTPPGSDAEPEPDKSAGTGERPAGWLDEDALSAAGFHPSDLEALRQRFEEIELERLFIRDQATREGWLNKPRFRRQMAKLQQDYDGLRDEYGDDDYDWILYAAGRTNRVVTTLVMQDSPAESAGLVPGDVIVAYDGDRVLTVAELQKATTLGQPGQTVAVDVLRDDDELRFYIPVGPLGVQLKPVRIEPRTTR